MHFFLQYRCGHLGNSCHGNAQYPTTKMIVAYKEPFIDQEKVNLPPCSVFYNMLDDYPSWIILCIDSFNLLDKFRPF